MISQISVLVVEDTTCNISTPAIAATSVVGPQLVGINMGDKCLDPFFEELLRGKQ